MGYDPVVALMFTLFSIAFFIHWYKTERLYLLLLSAAALSLGDSNVLCGMGHRTFYHHYLLDTYI